MGRASWRSAPGRRPPSGNGVVILPDVRGLHPYYEELALRFAERGIEARRDRLVRADGARRRPIRGLRVHAPRHADHVGRASARTSRPASPRCGPVTAARAAPASVFTLGFCMGGRMSFLAGTLGLDLAGVIGFYGTLVGPWRNDAPEPVAEAGRIGSPVLGLFGGADAGITPEAIAAFDAALDGGRHRRIGWSPTPGRRTASSTARRTSSPTRARRRGTRPWRSSRPTGPDAA